MIEMHNGTSQVVVKGTTLDMIHGSRDETEKAREGES